jgi:hypothetical protein
MRRRLALALPTLALPGLLLAAPVARAAPAPISFRLVRNGTAVGSHQVAFRDLDGGVLEARSLVRVEVKLVGITVYRYSHETVENWRGDRLLALGSRLDRNGTPGFCEARAEGGQILLRGTAGEARLPAQAAPLTWWRQATLTSGVPLFDPRRGEPVAPGLNRMPLPGGGLRVVVVGGEGADITYDAAGTWVGFATTGEDGSAVRYERA